jgi:UDP-glucose 4-epimerase
LTISNGIAGKRILVLGGLGFIGSNLTLRLVASGAQVSVLDCELAHSGANRHNLDPVTEEVRVIEADIRDHQGLVPYLSQTDIVFCLAGQASHVVSMAEPHLDQDINCRAHLAILETCRQRNPQAVLVHAGTRQVYGSPVRLPVDEAHPLAPTDILGIHNLATDQYFTLYARTHGMRCVSLRLTNTYGPRQQLRGTTQGVIGVFLRQAMDGEAVSIFGDGEQVRDFSFVDDVVDALILAALTPDLAQCVYNIGSSEVYSLLGFVEALRKFCEFDHSIVPFPPEYQAIAIGDYCTDYGMFSAETGWAPKTSLADGLAKTVTYFRDKLDLYR